MVWFSPKRAEISVSKKKKKKCYDSLNVHYFFSPSWVSLILFYPMASNITTKKNPKQNNEHWEREEAQWNQEKEEVGSEP